MPAVPLSKGEYALFLSRGEGMAPYVYDFGVQGPAPIATKQEEPMPSHQTAMPAPAPASAADFTSKPHADPAPAQVFKDASIGVFCDGNPDVHHDGVTVSALTPGGPAEEAGIKAGDVILGYQ